MSVCRYGPKLDGNRCPTCLCSETPIERCNFTCDHEDMAFVPLNDRLCKCVRNCHGLTMCSKKCRYGFEKDSHGCDMCKCHGKLLKICYSNCFFLTFKFNLEKEATISQSQCLIQETGLTVQDGSMWFDGCRECLCSKGNQLCTLTTCQKVDCPKPMFVKNLCCPTCIGKFQLKSCVVSRIRKSTFIWILDWICSNQIKSNSGNP
jgi:hypothetical protein